MLKKAFSVTDLESCMGPHEMITRRHNDSGPNGGAVSAERSAKSDYSLRWYNPSGL